MCKKNIGGIEDNGFVGFVQHVLNGSISDLQDRVDGDKFKLGEARPRTRDDAMQLLFKDGSAGVKLIKEKNYGCAMAQVLKYACMVTRHGVDSRRFEENVYKWSNAHNYPFVLGNATASDRKWSFMDWSQLLVVCRAIHGTLT